jgi:hypothetical protein
MVSPRALKRNNPPDSARNGIRAIISTELFNDFKAQAANFKSPAAKHLSESMTRTRLIEPDHDK